MGKTDFINEKTESYYTMNEDFTFLLEKIGNVEHELGNNPNLSDEEKAIIFRHLTEGFYKVLERVSDDFISRMIDHTRGRICGCGERNQKIDEVLREIQEPYLYGGE